jgi:hypothetical protein
MSGKFRLRILWETQCYQVGQRSLTSLGLLGPHGEGATFAATTRGLAGRTEGEERLLRKGV